MGTEVNKTCKTLRYDTHSIGNSITCALGLLCHRKKIPTRHVLHQVCRIFLS